MNFFTTRCIWIHLDFHPRLCDCRKSCTPTGRVEGLEVLVASNKCGLPVPAASRPLPAPHLRCRPTPGFHLRPTSTPCTQAQVDASGFSHDPQEDLDPVNAPLNRSGPDLHVRCKYLFLTQKNNNKKFNLVIWWVEQEKKKTFQWILYYNLFFILFFGGF